MDVWVSMDEQQNKPGRIRCLRCSKFFDSWDIRANRICVPCDAINSRVRLPRTTASRIYTHDGSHDHQMDSGD